MVFELNCITAIGTEFYSADTAKAVPLFWAESNYPTKPHSQPKVSWGAGYPTSFSLDTFGVSIL